MMLDDADAAGIKHLPKALEKEPNAGLDSPNTEQHRLLERNNHD